MLGGRLLNRELVTTGSRAVREISVFRADLCYLGVCALHEDVGVSTLGLMLAALAPNSWLSVAGFALTGCGMANLVPLLFSLAAARAGTDVDRATSSVFATGYLGFLIGPPLVGFISNHTSLPIALLCLAGGVLLVGSTIFCLNGLHGPAEAMLDENRRERM
jgi:MFS family permease